MSLIHKINGNLLLALTERAGGASSASSSSISGMGTGNVSGNDTVSLSPGLAKGASAFAYSYQRIGNAVAAYEQSIDKQRSIIEVVGKLKEFADESASTQITDNERITLDRKFKALIRDYKALLSEGDEEDADVLSMSDLREVLQDNGINFSQGSLLTDSFNKSGGKDSRLGKESVTIGDQNIVQLDDLSIENIASAQEANTALEKLGGSLEDDMENSLVIHGELIGALRFALYGGGAFDDASSGVMTANGADSLADEIVSYIKTNTGDASIAAHSDIDSFLANYLLG